MDCNRCGGAMAYENFSDAGNSFNAWRCVNCGEITDEIILQNRALTVRPEKKHSKFCAAVPQDGRRSGSLSSLKKTQTVEQRNEMYRLLGIRVPRGSVPMPVPRRPPEKKMDWLPSDKLIDAPFDPSSRRG